eukprot:CAMPEP_0197175638 /NCGR_PEP_ID=MMETSP1423-20130617/1800_1 /TAXON_ID=476441 /ORGANISM="Pseudo-nitzschia heimii, Strain UNC1101" /LENGTH=267 /DNA_ID=CAMNT_0042624843 /DNA_START=39 /DNA_END=842 /DNA_ORIENTATION=-
MSPQNDTTQPLTSTSGLRTSKLPRSKKKVYLIRHAESEENRRIAALSRSFQNLKRLSLPKISDLVASGGLLNVSAQIDSNVSDVGARQIAHMGEKIRSDKFVESSGIELVVHSPLLRARQTSEGMLGCVATSSSCKEKRADSVSRVTETSLLLEKKPAEWTPIYHDTFMKRISDFETWLGEQPEKVVAIVGHSQFFKAMLGLDHKFGNCDVWKVDFGVPLPKKVAGSGYDRVDNLSGGGEHNFIPQSCWSNLEKVFTSEIEGSPKSG